MGYPLVNVTNSTSSPVSGTVEYASIFCSNDNYNVAPNGGTWTASSRGVCLVTKVTANVHLPDGRVIPATPYESSGTSYSTFAVIQQGVNYVVTRVVNLVDSQGELLYAEPTEQQK